MTHHGLMMIYDIHMHLDSFDTIISDGSKYIAAIFNTNTQIYICIHEHTHTHTHIYIVCCIDFIDVQFLHF
jgi:hypothetical protein